MLAKNHVHNHFHVFVLDMIGQVFDMPVSKCTLFMQKMAADNFFVRKPVLENTFSLAFI